MPTEWNAADYWYLYDRTDTVRLTIDQSLSAFYAEDLSESEYDDLRDAVNNDVGSVVKSIHSTGSWSWIVANAPPTHPVVCEFLANHPGVRLLPAFAEGLESGHLSVRFDGTATLTDIADFAEKAGLIPLHEPRSATGNRWACSFSDPSWPSRSNVSYSRELYTYPEVVGARPSLAITISVGTL